LPDGNLGFSAYSMGLIKQDISSVKFELNLIETIFQDPSTQLSEKVTI
jgi:hypothetical protein